MRILFIIFFSFGLSGILALRPPIIREYFGTRNFGTIYGLAHIFITIGTVVSPPVAGWVFDTRGVYDPVWLVLGVVCMMGVILMLAMPSAPRISSGD